MSDLATNSALISSELVTASRVYLELGFIKHLPLGRMLASKIKDSVSYNRLIEFIYSDKFTNRMTDDILRLIDIEMGDGKVIDRNVMILSPILTGADLVVAFVKVAMESRSISDPDNNTLVDIVLNASELTELKDDEIDAIEKDFSEMFQSNVIFDTKRIEDYTDEEILRFDAFFINDIARFNARFLDKLNDLSFITKHVHAQKIIPGDKYDVFLKNDPDEQFLQIYTIMSTACVFNFLAESAIVDP